ncbi:uncharacterized protein FIESC28_01083 [Fusarium coffeatum]|uniref:DUF4238 domain-containing protein n=1 Tax=Fusarium coffeatum TaxID=231269 RepID=A0A366SBR4_9HYPO|nr:uncharacterized protein FIESC28_01083 [Fusarium coffeatum]RBR26055.1 hypothetical protein FIESC28_01083 [Fusarium coffeatum]
MEAAKPEYQHFVPQFILRNFNHPFLYPSTPKGRLKCKKRHHETGKYPGDPVVNCLQLLPTGFKIEEHSIRRVCGLNDMYTDRSLTAEVPRQLERKFSRLECSTSLIIRKIVTAQEQGQKDVELTRTQRTVLRKFLFLLGIRGTGFFQRYNCETIEDYKHTEDQALLRDFMESHGIERPIDVWLHGLSAIVDLDMDVGGQWQETISSAVYFAIAERFVEHVTGYWMAICTPANTEEEFVLTENGYNVHEGPTVGFEDKETGECISLGPAFHYFAPIAPRVMILLRSQHLPEPLDDGDPDNKAFRRQRREIMINSLYGPGTESIMEDLPVHIAFNSYSKVIDGRRIPLPGWDGRLNKNDCFTFPIFQISTEYTHKMNGLLLDNAFHGSTIIFNRQDVFLDLVEWYLTEPCEVGKNLTGENRETKRKYIEQLTIFMAAQGREVSTKIIDWPTRKDLDIARFREAGIASVRWAQELAKDRGDESEQAGTKMEKQPVNEADPGPEGMSPNESGTSREDAEEPDQLPDEVTNFGSYLRLQSYLQEDTLLRLIYERITELAAASPSHPNVPRDVSTGELEHSLAMFRIWHISAHMDRDDKFEGNGRLEKLLQSFQTQEPNFVFLHFLKRIRHALKRQEQASLVVDEKDLEGPEDDIDDGKL